MGLRNKPLYLVSAQNLEEIQYMCTFICKIKGFYIISLIFVLSLGCLFAPTSFSLMVLFLVTRWSLYNAPLWSWSWFISYSSPQLSSIGWALFLLATLISALMCILSLYDAHPSSPQLVRLIIFLLLSLFLIFSSSNILVFYLIFEISLIPIFWAVLGWGGQPERLPAAIRLLIYTVTASLPLLMVVVILSFQGLRTIFLATWLLAPANSTSLSSSLTLVLILAFLVKFPLFLVHLWLPKAHVEAPAVGSIILAALLLKLGGYGILLFSRMYCSPAFLYLAQRVALTGGLCAAILCMRQKDIKILIAYSSVCHIGIAIAALATPSFWGLKAAIFVIIAHGLSSSGLFGIAFYPYLASHRRNILILKNSLMFLPTFTLAWLLLCVRNIGGPLTINLLREILSISFLWSLNIYSAFPLFITAFLAVAYCLVLYSLVTHSQFTQKTGLLRPSNYTEISVGLIHRLYSVALILTISLLYYFYIITNSYTRSGTVDNYCSNRQGRSYKSSPRKRKIKPLWVRV